MRGYLAFQLDGVDYLHGSRRELLHVEPTGTAPAADLAAQALHELLAALTGTDQRLRAGWAAVRWARGAPPTWEGPAYLFSFEASTAGSFEVLAAGEDPGPWPPLELDDDAPPP